MPSPEIGDEAFVERFVAAAITAGWSTRSICDLPLKYAFEALGRSPPIQINKHLVRRVRQSLASKQRVRMVGDVLFSYGVHQAPLGIILDYWTPSHSVVPHIGAALVIKSPNSDGKLKVYPYSFRRLKLTEGEKSLEVRNFLLNEVIIPLAEGFQLTVNYLISDNAANMLAATKAVISEITDIPPISDAVVGVEAGPSSLASVYGKFKEEPSKLVAVSSGCLAHSSNLALRSLSAPGSQFGFVIDLICTTRRFTSFSIVARLYSQEGGTRIREFFEVRWNSSVQGLRSVLKNWAIIQKVVRRFEPEGDLAGRLTGSASRALMAVKALIFSRRSHQKAREAYLVLRKLWKLTDTLQADCCDAASGLSHFERVIKDLIEEKCMNTSSKQTLSDRLTKTMANRSFVPLLIPKNWRDDREWQKQAFADGGAELKRFCECSPGIISLESALTSLEDYLLRRGEHSFEMGQPRPSASSYWSRFETSVDLARYMVIISMSPSSSAAIERIFSRSRFCMNLNMKASTIFECTAISWDLKDVLLERYSRATDKAPVIDLDSDSDADSVSDLDLASLPSTPSDLVSDILSPRSPCRVDSDAESVSVIYDDSDLSSGSDDGMEVFSGAASDVTVVSASEESVDSPVMTHAHKRSRTTIASRDITHEFLTKNGERGMRCRHHLEDESTGRLATWECILYEDTSAESSAPSSSSRPVRRSRRVYFIYYVMTDQRTDETFTIQQLRGMVISGEIDFIQ
ncbi:hypothetical protein FOZ60_007276 [Perkinsus olseni]|uniref:Uncharacterized protein n=1 Tax=Perkinsus olseni TaxID=32597 RepID=A0A7J6NMQ1_PEROL|nr:hypothetical protein FOZ60_007276 [Perkinsus olseni]